MHEWDDFVCEMDVTADWVAVLWPGEQAANEVSKTPLDGQDSVVGVFAWDSVTYMGRREETKCIYKLIRNVHSLYKIWQSALKYNEGCRSIA